VKIGKRARKRISGKGGYQRPPQVTGRGGGIRRKKNLFFTRTWLAKQAPSSFRNSKSAQAHSFSNREGQILTQGHIAGPRLKKRESPTTRREEEKNIIEETRPVVEPLGELQRRETKTRTALGEWGRGKR